MQKISTYNRKRSNYRKLKKGVDRDGNAIKILKLYKYPDSVIAMAERLRLNYKNKV